jgi:hypothetical protein
MGLLELNKEVTAWRELLALTENLVSTGIKSAIKTLQMLCDEDSPLGVPNFYKSC